MELRDMTYRGSIQRACSSVPFLAFFISRLPPRLRRHEVDFGFGADLY